MRESVPLQKPDNQRSGRDELVQGLSCRLCGQKFATEHSLTMHEIKAFNGQLQKCPPTK